MNQKKLYDAFIVDIDEYNLVKEIGRGRFGVMIKAEKEDDDGNIAEFAIRESSRSKDDAPDSVLEKHFFREIETFLQIKEHPVICKFHGYSVKPKRRLIFEYLEKGSLQNIFNKLLEGDDVDYWNGTMKSKTVFGIACSLLHLQNQGMFHRYLTPSSILFDSHFEPRLVDFFYCKNDSADINVKHTVVNTPWPVYRAPELNTTHYDHLVDNFAFGVILYQIITGKEAFNSKLGIAKVQQLIASGRRPKPPEECPKLAKMVNDLWSPIPKNRPDLIFIIKSLKDYDKELFPDTDMDEYNRYKELILKSTDLNENQTAFLNQPKITPESVQTLQKQLKEAEKGNPKDMLKVARSYEKGFGTMKNVSEAIKWYQKAAEKDDPEALYKIANFYCIGKFHIEPDNAKYIEYLKKASDKRYPPAFNDYAVLLLKGSNGVKADIPKAIEMLTKMANPPHNFPDAMYHLARFYKENNDLEKSVGYYLKARENGSEFANCDYSIMLLSGEGVSKNKDEGLEILKASAERGFPLANLNLGIIYEKGDFEVEKNPELSYQLLQRAANSNMPEAMVKIGKALFRGSHAGLPIDEDHILAARYFENAAKKDNAEGLHSWGTFLQNGYGGTPKDVKLAINFYQRASNKGFVASMLRLGDLYSSGVAGAKDLGKARTYYEMAKKKGSKIAEEKLKDL